MGLRFNQLVNLRVWVNYGIAIGREALEGRSAVAVTVAECDWWEELMGGFLFTLSCCNQRGTDA